MTTSRTASPLEPTGHRRELARLVGQIQTLPQLVALERSLHLFVQANVQRAVQTLPGLEPATSCS
jgi:hypothetical protein